MSRLNRKLRIACGAVVVAFVLAVLLCAVPNMDNDFLGGTGASRLFFLAVGAGAALPVILVGYLIARDIEMSENKHKPKGEPDN